MVLRRVNSYNYFFYTILINDLFEFRKMS